MEEGKGREEEEEEAIRGMKTGRMEKVMWHKGGGVMTEKTVLVRTLN